MGVGMHRNCPGKDGNTESSKWSVASDGYTVAFTKKHELRRDTKDVLDSAVTALNFINAGTTNSKTFRVLCEKMTSTRSKLLHVGVG
jgi:hypothetical protein